MYPFLKPMVLILDGSTEHKQHIIWSKSDILKAIGYIERVVKSEIFFRKRSILLHTCATCSELQFYISTVLKLY